LNVRGTETPSEAWNTPTHIITTNQPTHNNFTNFIFLKLTSNLVIIKRGWGCYDSSHSKIPGTRHAGTNSCNIVFRNIWHKTYSMLCLPNRRENIQMYIGQNGGWKGCGRSSHCPV
jgi:hypothetical protein